MASLKIFCLFVVVCLAAVCQAAPSHFGDLGYSGYSGGFGVDLGAYGGDLGTYGGDLGTYGSGYLGDIGGYHTGYGHGFGYGDLY